MNSHNLKIEALIVGEFKTNCYLICDIKSRECIVIDPGDDGDFLLEQINKMEIEPKSIVLTHGHSDHLLAAAEIALTYKVPVLMDAKDRFLSQRYAKNIKLEKVIRLSASTLLKIVKPINYKQAITLGGTKAQIIPTPGHTPGSVCLYFKREKLLFCGDLAFADGAIGRYDYWYSDKNAIKSSLKILSSIPNGVVVYPGHGQSFTINHQLSYNI
jgi:hydroxyacylglutathione hydrolase